MGKVSLLGFSIDDYSYAEAVNFADCGQVVTINPEMINYFGKNSDLKKIIDESELVIPDGIGVQLGLKILGKNVRRIAGIDFAQSMLEKFNGCPIALVGAKEEVLQDAIKNLKIKYPEINIVYSQNGYFEEEDKILNNIVSANPKLLLVALGSPKQEEFIYKLKKSLPNSLMIGVGGSFDVWSGHVMRAPIVFQKLGLEWLYRTIKDPARFKRIFPALPLFVLKVLKYGEKDAK